jgi:serine/threonine protein phosphatase 1
MSKRRFVIGDVHGHYDTLCSLLDGIGLDSDDQLYFLGDLIDRGPQSSQVIEFIKENNFNSVKGNHEIMLLDVLGGTGEVSPQAFQAWLHNGGYDTVMSYENNIPPSHIEWLKSLPLYLDLGDFWLVHAGLHPQIPLAEQTSEQFCWIRDQFHSISEPYFKDKLIITGHTITFTFPGVKSGKLVAGEGWLDIDTGIYRHSQGWLTTVELNEKTVYQVDSFGKNFRKLSLNEAVRPFTPRVNLIEA